jgi:prephenate dehydratase
MRKILDRRTNRTRFLVVGERSIWKRDIKMELKEIGWTGFSNVAANLFINVL